MAFRWSQPSKRFLAGNWDLAGWGCLEWFKDINCGLEVCGESRRQGVGLLRWRRGKVKCWVSFAVQVVRVELGLTCWLGKDNRDGGCLFFIFWSGDGAGWNVGWAKGKGKWAWVDWVGVIRGWVMDQVVLLGFLFWVVFCVLVYNNTKGPFG